jgi:hypothetical protein
MPAMDVFPLNQPITFPPGLVLFVMRCDLWALCRFLTLAAAAAARASSEWVLGWLLRSTSPHVLRHPENKSESRCPWGQYSSVAMCRTLRCPCGRLWHLQVNPATDRKFKLGHCPLYPTLDIDQYLTVPGGVTLSMGGEALCPSPASRLGPRAVQRGFPLCPSPHQHTPH